MNLTSFLIDLICKLGRRSLIILLLSIEKLILLRLVLIHHVERSLGRNLMRSRHHWCSLQRLLKLHKWLLLINRRHYWYTSWKRYESLVRWLLHIWLSSRKNRILSILLNILGFWYSNNSRIDLILILLRWHSNDWISFFWCPIRSFCPLTRIIHFDWSS